MSHPVDRSDAEGAAASDRRADEPTISLDKPAPAADTTAELPEARPRPSWGQPGPADAGAAASTPPATTPAAPYAQPGQPTYGQPGSGQPSYGQPSYGQPSAGQPGQPSAGQPSPGQPGQPPYGQPGQPSYGQPSYGQASGQPQHGWPQQPPPAQWQRGWQQPAWGPTPAQYGQDLGRQEERFAQFYGERPRTGLSVTALVLGILTLLISWAPLGSFVAVVLGVLTAIFGFIGLRRGGRGMAIGGLVVGGIGLVIAIAASIFYTNLFLDYLDVATSCADQVGRPDGQQFERCVTDRSSEYNPFDSLHLGL